MDYAIILALCFGFLFTLYLLPRWMFRARKANLVGKDVHKLHRPAIPELGGLPVVCGFVGAILVYIAFSVFLGIETSLIQLFAVATSILIATVIGVVDDILGWKIGLRKFQKAALTLAIALPIMVINSGNSQMFIPFFGLVDFWLFYPLLIIPLIIMFTAIVAPAKNGFGSIERALPKRTYITINALLITTSLFMCHFLIVAFL